MNCSWTLLMESRVKLKFTFPMWFTEIDNLTRRLLWAFTATHTRHRPFTDIYIHPQRWHWARWRRRRGVHVSILVGRMERDRQRVHLDRSLNGSTDLSAKAARLSSTLDAKQAGRRQTYTHFSNLERECVWNQTNWASSSSQSGLFRVFNYDWLPDFKRNLSNQTWHEGQHQRLWDLRHVWPAAGQKLKGGFVAKRHLRWSLSRSVGLQNWRFKVANKPQTV